MQDSECTWIWSSNRDMWQKCLSVYFYLWIDINMGCEVRKHIVSLRVQQKVLEWKFEVISAILDKKKMNETNNT